MGKGKFMISFAAANTALLNRETRLPNARPLCLRAEIKQAGINERKKLVGCAPRTESDK
jgi:hypothetical protein